MPAALVCRGLVAAALALAAAALLAQEAAPDERAARGRVTFRVYCGNCHGATARGDGELAQHLKTKPADLTRIAQRYDGKFPEDWIRKKIDGREAVRGHGMQEMPVWGLNFRNPEQPGDPEARVTAKLDDLVAYLRTIQVPAQKSH